MTPAPATPHRELAAIIAEHELDDLIVSAHGAPTSKRQWVTRLLREHSLSLGEVVMIGDALNDLEAARAVGIPCIGRTNPDKPAPFPTEERLALVADLGGAADVLRILLNPAEQR